MSSATFFWPNEDEPILEIEVERDGTIVSAYRHCEHLDAKLNCELEIRTRPVWLQRIDEFIRDHDWKQSGDPDLEATRECLAVIRKLHKQERLA